MFCLRLKRTTFSPIIKKLLLSTFMIGIMYDFQLEATTWVDSLSFLILSDWLYSLRVKLEANCVHIHIMHLNRYCVFLKAHTHTYEVHNRWATFHTITSLSVGIIYTYSRVYCVKFDFERVATYYSNRVQQEKLIVIGILIWNSSHRRWNLMQTLELRKICMQRFLAIVIVTAHTERRRLTIVIVKDFKSKVLHYLLAYLTMNSTWALFNHNILALQCGFRNHPAVESQTHLRRNLISTFSPSPIYFLRHFTVLKFRRTCKPVLLYS